MMSHPGHDALFNELLEISLESSGHDCVVLQDPEQASRFLDDDGMDAVVIEMDLADRSGLEWLEAASAERPDLPFRTLILTDSEVTPEIATRVGRLGARIVSKPVSLAQLEAEILDQLDRARASAIGGPDPHASHG